MQDTPTRTHTERDGQRETQRYSVMSSRTAPLLQPESVPVITQSVRHQMTQAVACAKTTSRLPHTSTQAHNNNAMLVVCTNTGSALSTVMSIRSRG